MRRRLIVGLLAAGLLIGLAPSAQAVSPAKEHHRRVKHRNHIAHINHKRVRHHFSKQRISAVTALGETSTVTATCETAVMPEVGRNYGGAGVLYFTLTVRACYYNHKVWTYTLHPTCSTVIWSFRHCSGELRDERVLGPCHQHNGHTVCGTVPSRYIYARLYMDYQGCVVWWCTERTMWISVTIHPNHLPYLRTHMTWDLSNP